MRELQAEKGEVRRNPTAMQEVHIIRRLVQLRLHIG